MSRHTHIQPWVPPDPIDVYSANALSRRGGGGGAGGAGSGGGAQKRLVVDVREFMSGLPGVLHARGYELAPVTLEWLALVCRGEWWGYTPVKGLA
eukprot:354188-Chlamydomonas_euryale.AAC.2